jgi:hypothetical protein
MWGFKKLSTWATHHVIKISPIVQCLQAKEVHFLKFLKKLLIYLLLCVLIPKIKFPEMHDIGAKNASKSKKQSIANLYHIPQYNGYETFVRIP